MYGGPSMSNIYGQQPWQEEARRRVYSESFGRGLSMQNASLNNASGIQQLLAQDYASSFLPRRATLGFGNISGFNMPSAGINVPKSVGGRQPDWWRGYERYQFPMM